MANELEEYFSNNEGYPRDPEALAELKEAIRNNEPNSEKLKNLFDQAYGEPVAEHERQFRAGFETLLANRSKAKDESPMPTSVTPEIPTLEQARQNFRSKVQGFVDAYEKYNPDIKDADVNSASGKPYRELKNFLDGKSLPKRDEENEAIAQMQILVSRLESEMRAKGGHTENEIKEATTALFQHLEATRDAEEVFKKAYQQDQKQAKDPQPPTDIEGFVKGNESLYQYNDGRNYTVMSTQNTKEGFQNALEHFAKSEDAAGNPRKWSNVNLVHPPVSTEKLMGNVKYKDNVFNQLKQTMDAGLYPANDIRKMVEALSGPSLNPRARWSSEKNKKIAQLKELNARVNKFKADRDLAKAGKTPESESMQATAGPNKTNNDVNKNKADKENNAAKQNKAAQDANKSNPAKLSLGKKSG